jgi:hypothetical protein
MKNNEIEALNFQGWPLPDDVLIELGRVMALWSSLENLLNLCLGQLAGFNALNDPKPFILVTHSTFPQRLDMLGALCEHLAADYPQLADYETTISALRAAQKQRNKFAHNSPVLDEVTGEIILPLARPRGSLKTSTNKIKIADIRRAAIEVDKASCSLYKLVLKRDIPPAEERYKA